MTGDEIRAQLEALAGAKLTASEARRRDFLERELAKIESDDGAAAVRAFQREWATREHPA